MKAQTRITLQTRLPLIWLALLLLAAILIPGKIWNSLLIGLGGMFLVSFLWAWRLSRGLSARRRLRFGWVSVGDRLSEEFEIVNSSTLPALWVEVKDESNVPGYQAAVVRSLGMESVDHWRQSAVCLQRGLFQLGPWELHSSDPFGIFRIILRYQQVDEIIIHPPIHSQIPVPLPSGQSSGQAKARRRSWQATINAASVRNYQPNDPLHHIHWPTSARRDELFVREFDLDAAGDIWLLLDLQKASQVGRGADGTEEHAVLLAASLAARALNQSRAVGLAAYGQEPRLIPPGRGQGQQWKLLRALALVRADGEQDLSVALRDLARVARRGSAAVVITASGGEQWLPEMLQLDQLGIPSHLVLLERASFGASAGSRGLQEAARQLGLPSYLIHQGEVGQPLLAQQRRGFWEFKVTGTGKVVTVSSPLEAGSKPNS